MNGTDPRRPTRACRPSGRVRCAGTLVVALLLLVAARTLPAGEVALSLDEALALAGRQNPEALAARVGAEAAERRAEAARRSLWPRVSVASRWSRADTPSTVFAHKLDSGAFAQDDFALERLRAPSALSHLATAITAEVPLDAAGTLAARADAEAADGRARRALADEAAQDVRLRVTEAYWRAALAVRLARAAEQALAGARAREADVEAGVAAGAALRADLLRTRARRRQREADLVERRADAAIAAAGLDRAIGAEPGVSYAATDAAAPPDQPGGDLDAWQLRALADRPALRAAAAALDARRAAARAAGRAGWPEAAAWGQLQDDRRPGGNAARSGAFGLVLRWNAFDAGRGKRAAAAALEANATELAARAARDEVRLEVVTAWNRAEASRARLAAAAGGAEEGREALRVVRERREQGLATLTDELETESASVEAEVGELRAAAEAAFAWAALRRAAGGL